MDCQVDTDLPGGDSFYDVTQMFDDAAAGKTPTRLFVSLSHSSWCFKICLVEDLFSQKTLLYRTRWHPSK